MTRQVVDFSTPEQREKLEELAGVKFSDADFADLADVTSVIFEFYYPEHDLLPPSFMRKDAKRQWWSRNEKDPRRAVVKVRCRTVARSSVA